MLRCPEGHRAIEHIEAHRCVEVPRIETQGNAGRHEHQAIIVVGTRSSHDVDVGRSHALGRAKQGSSQWPVAHEQALAVLEVVSASVKEEPWSGFLYEGAAPHHAATEGFFGHRGDGLASHGHVDYRQLATPSCAL